MWRLNLCYGLCKRGGFLLGRSLVESPALPGEANNNAFTLLAEGKTQVRKIVSGASFMGQNMLDAHFGIGEADEIDSVTVYWPSGEVEQRTAVKANQTITFVEP